MSIPNRFTLLSGLLAYSLSLSATPVAPGWNNLGAGLNGPVNAVVVSGDDVYVGGGFTDAGGITDADYLARWDGANWHAVAPGRAHRYAVSLLAEPIFMWVVILLTQEVFQRPTGLPVGTAAPGMRWAMVCPAPFGDSYQRQ